MNAPMPHPDAQTPQSDWTLFRIDDNGNKFPIQSGLTHEAAQRLAAQFEARGHKQHYWAERTHPTDAPS
ncbi:MAG TPA: hypothetical protein VD970_07775 [Acetobacteraceae bacterium]|nr:hypothetical protein [Acetobacteraceae bacterium]